MATKTKTVPAAKAFDEVQRQAEKIRNDDAHEVQVMDIGDAWPQGDVLLVRLAGLPKKVVRMENPSAQLAPGTTQGSRHTLQSMQGLALYRLRDATPLDGPVIESPDVPFTVEHPEHGDVTLPAGVYVVRYQRAFAEELRAVAD